VFGNGELPWKDGDFVPTNTVPFKPNTLLAFAPCVTSWHAVMNYTGHESTRDSIQVMPPILSLPLIASEPGVRLGHTTP
jgi:hypothetical protein